MTPEQAFEEWWKTTNYKIAPSYEMAKAAYLAATERAAETGSDAEG